MEAKMKAFVVKYTLAILSVMTLSLAQAAPDTKILGPEQYGQDFYQIGNQKLKLRAFIVSTVDLRQVDQTVETLRSQKGTHAWDWKIGYTHVSPQQSLVLSWNNLDSGEHGWIAVARDGQDRWFKASSRKMTWVDYSDTHLIRKDTTNGYDVVSRISKTDSDSIAYAFSKTL